MKYLVHSILSALLFVVFGAIFLSPEGSFVWGTIGIISSLVFAVYGMPE